MRKGSAGPRWRAVAFVVAFGWTAHTAAAQGHGGGGPGGGGFGGGGGGFGRPSLAPSRPAAGGGPPESRTSGLQLAPSGRWWDDSSIAKGLRLDSRQQHRMDDLFGANRDTLFKLYKSLQQEESALARAIRVRDLDEGQIFQQIDRVTGARAELAKAEVHMSLQMRKELTPEQLAKLDELREQQTPQQ